MIYVTTMDILYIMCKYGYIFLPLDIFHFTIGNIILLSEDMDHTLQI